MSKTPHRQGPWKWYWRVEDGVPDCGVYSEMRIGMAYAVARCPKLQSKEQWEADARLIAAAPELLEVAQAYIELVDDLIVGGYCEPSTQGQLARAVIAKATGADKDTR